jgi:hypothetical protein
VSSITENDVKILCDHIAPHLRKMLSSSGASAGDLAVMEDALGVALNAVRSLLVEAALKSCSGSAHGTLHALHVRSLSPPGRFATRS